MIETVLKATVIMLALQMSPSILARSDVQPAVEEGPLAGFQRLVGGQWHLGNSYQEFEWGVGRRSVKARGYFIVAGEPKLVSEGVWFWHPAEKKIKGVFTAVDMPVDLFVYTSRFEGADLVSDLVAFSGNVQSYYTETWAFLDESHFEWTLHAVTADGPRREMGGTYTRQTAEGAQKEPD